MAAPYALWVQAVFECAGRLVIGDARSRDALRRSHDDLLAVSIPGLL
jgi:hypothetical protein